jgi:hypothetical protein
MAIPPTPTTGGDKIRAYLLDVAGLAFVAAAIYVGLFHGVNDGAFPAFTALAGGYLGIKAP